MELRCLMSSSGSSQLFDLRCLVREKMVEFLRETYPHALPTLRIEMQDKGAPGRETAPAAAPLG
jgi:ABC-type thiamine transport system ATPase subunit